MSQAGKTRFSIGAILRFLGGHLAAAVIAGLAFTLVRTGLALPSPPGLGPIALLWFLAAIQCVIVGGAAAILGVIGAARWPGAAGVIFPAAGLICGLALALGVDQLNLTFLLPAAAAGAAFGLALFRFAWRPAIAAR
jgi:hypothetical protein